MNLSGDVFLMVPDLSFSDVSWKRLAKKKKKKRARISLPLNFLDGSISVARCNVLFFFSPILLSAISKKGFWSESTRGRACECYHYEHNFQLEYYFSRKLHNKWNWQFQDETENRWGQRLSEYFPTEEGTVVCEDSQAVCFKLYSLQVLVLFSVSSSTTGWKMDSLFLFIGFMWVSLYLVM